MKYKDYLTGMRLSLPVFIGYFAVSFGFGALAVTKGVSVLQSTLISLTNLTSAGQFAGLSVIAAAAPLLEMVLTQLVINSRYALMSLALGQRMGDRIGLLPRFLIAFHNTDEIFALAMKHDRPLTVPFMMGLGILPMIGWTGGTLLGAAAGTFLPEIVRTSLSVALYGMFIAILVPQAKKSKPILCSVLTASALACAFRWLPGLREVSEGMAIVICAVAASLLCALLFPIGEERGEDASGEAGEEGQAVSLPDNGGTPGGGSERRENGRQTPDRENVPAAADRPSDRKGAAAP